MDKQKQKFFNARNLGKTVFGRENRSNQFDKLILPIERTGGPGPGSYAHYTYFNNDEKAMRMSGMVSRSVQNTPNLSQQRSP